jgi:hypothetical protein
MRPDERPSHFYKRSHCGKDCAHTSQRNPDRWEAIPDRASAETRVAWALASEALLNAMLVVYDATATRMRLNNISEAALMLGMRA